MNRSSAQTTPKRYRRRRKSRAGNRECHGCKALSLFSWTCRCGFALCQGCMHENMWGMSCNGITWRCPDCGLYNGFGNQ